MEAIVRKKHQTGLEVSILPEEMPALLPTVHLSDHVTNCPLLWAGLQEGDTISDAVCLSRNKESIVSSLADWAFCPFSIFVLAQGTNKHFSFSS